MDFVGSRTKSEKGVFGAWVSIDSMSGAELMEFLFLSSFICIVTALTPVSILPISKDYVEYIDGWK